MGRFILVDSEDLEKRFLKIALSEGIREHILPDGFDYKDVHEIPKDKPLRCYLLQDDDTDIGIICLLEFDALKRSVCDIGCLAEHRGKKFKNLVKACLDYYCGNTGHSLVAFIRKDNRQSFYFCRSIGCKIVNKVGGNHILRYEVGYG